MTVRVGIEVTPSRCSLISVQDGQYGSVVRDFHSIEYGPGDPSELGQELRRLVAAGRFQQAARVVLWDARALHMSLEAPATTPNVEAFAMARARREAPAFGTWASNAWAGTATGRVVDLAEGGAGREVLFASMSAEDARRLLKPIQRAGLAIESITTPVLALTGLAASGVAASGGLMAFVVMNRDMGAVAIMQGSRLLHERRFAWSFRADQAGTDQRLAERYGFAARMAAELRPAFDEARASAGVPVAYVVAFGDIPSLRSVAMPLTDELDVEVETLDSLAGIDADQLPERADLFREQIALLRLAWAVAARNPLVRLTPPTRWEPLSRRGLRVAVGGMAAAAAVTVAVLLWPAALEREDVMTDRLATMARGRDAAPAPTTGASRPEPAASRSPSTSEPVAPGTSADPTDRELDDGPVPFDTRAEYDGVPQAVERGPESVDASLADESREAGDPLESTQLATQTVPAEPGRPVDPIDPAATGGLPTNASAAPEVARRPPPVLRSILYASDRRLALIGRRIVGIGDVVDDLEVVDITPDGVVLRSPDGVDMNLALRADVSGVAR